MSIKQERVAEKIRQILSELLMREVSDPRLQSITVTEVKVDPEIMFARVYVNALGDESREKEVMQGLKRANSFLRRQVAGRLNIRTAPELRFVWDKALAEGDKVERLLNKLDIQPDHIHDVAATTAVDDPYADYDVPHADDNDSVEENSHE